MKRLLVCLVVCLGTIWCILQASGQGPADYDALVHQGNEQLQAGSNDLALTTANTAIKAAPERWEAYALAGGALMNLKRYEEAADDFSHAIDHAPEAKQAGLRDLRKQCLAAELGVAAPMQSAPATPETTPAATTQAEIVLWKSIENSTNPADFQSYLAQYPDGAFTVLAKRHLAEIQLQVEQTQWKSIENSSIRTDFEAYLKQYPKGAFVEQARNRLASLDQAKAQEVARQRDLPTWTDPATGLEWTGSDNGGQDLTWQQAASYCEESAWAEHTDWRLPTSKELSTIYDRSQKKKLQLGQDHISIHVNAHLSASHADYWSSSTGAAPGQALKVSFFYGHAPAWSSTFSDGAGAFCVRSPAK